MKSKAARKNSTIGQKDGTPPRERVLLIPAKGKAHMIDKADHPAYQNDTK